MARAAETHQVAALPWRMRDGTLEVLLVTTRESRRWVIPKGWPMVGKTDWEAAQTEALEEAGVRGQMSDTPCGSYVYSKKTYAGNSPIRVTIYAMHVQGELASWPEAAERARAWYPAETAGSLVEETDLAAIIRNITGLVPEAAVAEARGADTVRRGLLQRVFTICSKMIGG